MAGHDIFPVGVLEVLGASEGKSAEELAQELLEQEAREGGNNEA